MPGVVGMGQSLELRGLGSAKNPYPQDEDRRGRGVGVRVNSSAKRKVNNAWRMRNIGPLSSGLAGRRCTGQTFASSAFATRNAFRARFRATSRNVIRRLIRMGGPSRARVRRPVAGQDPSHSKARPRSPGRRSRSMARAALRARASPPRHPASVPPLARRSAPPPVPRSAPAACRPTPGTGLAPVAGLSAHSHSDRGQRRPPPTRRRRQPFAPSVDRAICSVGLGPH